MNVMLQAESRPQSQPVPPHGGQPTGSSGNSIQPALRRPPTNNFSRGHKHSKKPPHPPQDGSEAGTPSTEPMVPGTASADSKAAGETSSAGCKVQVSGYPSYTQPQDLTRVFSKFGFVKVEFINSNYAVLAYNTAASAASAVQASTKVNVYGEFLTVTPFTKTTKPQTNKREFPRSKQKGEVVDPKQIDLSGDFYEQLDKILATIRLTQEEVEHIGILYNDVQEVLQGCWPGCVAMPFGSIVFGLGIKSSDADCYVNLPPQYRTHQHQANIVNKAKRELSRYPRIFSEILSIPRANTPIVKFFHIPTETNCDLSFKTLLGVQNSKLISFLLRLDPRLIPLCVIIKYWSKAHGFTGTGKLSNYALTMLVIFYLQQPSLRIIPTVEWLQRDRSTECVVDSWNTGFSTQVPPASCETSLPELLGGFFGFYSIFNFEEMMICPYLGYPLKKELFKDLNQLPNEFARYKDNVIQGNCYPLRYATDMCIQDPIEQCHNVGCSISNRLATEIKAYFKFAAVAYEAEKSNNLQGFLKKILLQKPKIIKERNTPEYRVHLFPKIIANIITPEWKSVVRELVFTVFEKILKLKLGKMEEKVTPNARRQKEKYTGTISKLIWKRKQFNKVYSNMHMDLEEKERKITEEILRVDKNTVKLDFQLTVTYNNEPKSGMLAIKLVNGNVESFKEFGKFFISVTQQWFMHLLRPHTNNTEMDVAAKIAETLAEIDADASKDDEKLESDVEAGDDRLSNNTSKKDAAGIDIGHQEPISNEPSADEPCLEIDGNGEIPKPAHNDSTETKLKVAMTKDCSDN